MPTKIKKKEFERDIKKVVQKYAPESKDFLLSVFGPGWVGYINTNKTVLEHGRMLALMLKWCAETADQLHQVTNEPVFSNASRDCEANQHFLIDFLKNAKAVLKEGPNGQ